MIVFCALLLKYGTKTTNYMLCFSLALRQEVIGEKRQETKFVVFRAPHFQVSSARVSVHTVKEFIPELLGHNVNGQPFTEASL